ncbi:MAG TPA: endo-1,4-beta-xylanase [Candidatus Eremiobacteraceae bacterium]|nr:endo-1,4-beta-xylanase [Candidatus Eremiobacteraceae bacterium]
MLGVVGLAVLAAAMLPAQAQAPVTLKEAYQGAFVIGAAVNAAQFTGKDARGAALIKTQFNSITPENVLKWENVHPRLDTYAFDLADKYVAFGEENHMFIVGHCLVWHNQVPSEVFRDAQGNLVTRKVLLKRMRDHIHTVVGRYKGRIKSWDVVNEALNDDGSLRETLWLKIIGKDYIAKAFQYAHQADPQAQLTYNDFSLENEPKRNGAIALIKELKAKGVPITSVGLQGHDSLTWPSVEQQDATIAAFGKLGVKVVISELDIDVLPSATAQGNADITANVKPEAGLNPYASELPDSVQEELARHYAELFGVFLKHRDVVSRVTFWGVTDGDSWKNDWPVRGRTNYPLLFDRSGQPKPAFDAVVSVATSRR